jgi:hypothetical protein
VLDDPSNVLAREVLDAGPFARTMAEELVERALHLLDPTKRQTGTWALPVVPF